MAAIVHEHGPESLLTVGKWDDWQLQNIAFRPCDIDKLKEEGAYVPLPVDNPKKRRKKISFKVNRPPIQGFAAIYREIMRKRGMSEQEINERIVKR